MLCDFEVLMCPLLLFGKYGGDAALVPRLGKSSRLTEQIFQRSTQGGLLVAVLDDDGGVEREAPGIGVGVCFALADCPRTGNHYGVFGDDQWQLVGSAENGAVDEIEDGGAAGEDGSGGQDGSLADDGALVNAGVAADEHIVLNDDRAGVNGFKDSTDLCGGAEVNAFTDLRAGADEGMRVNHCPFVN